MNLKTREDSISNSILKYQPTLSACILRYVADTLVRESSYHKRYNTIMPHNPPGGLRSVFSTFRTPFCMLVGILKRMGSYFCKQKQIDFSLSLHTPKSIHIPIF